MNTNLPLVPRTSDGPTWSNGWGATGVHLDMIAKQYKNGKRKGQKQHWNGVKNGLEQGQKRVLNGIKNGISSNSRIWNGEEWPFFAVPHLSSRFLAVPPLFSHVFHDFGQKWEKTGAQKWRNGNGENAFLSHFFPIPVFSRSLPSASLVITSLHPHKRSGRP